jgi:hypothetical protein
MGEWFPEGPITILFSDVDCRPGSGSAGGPTWDTQACDLYRPVIDLDQHLPA